MMKAKHFMYLALLCAAIAITLALLDILIPSLIYLLLGFLSATLYWEKSNEEENVVDSEGEYTLFSSHQRETPKGE